jgi:hypothetical protein
LHFDFCILHCATRGGRTEDDMHEERDRGRRGRVATAVIALLFVVVAFERPLSQAPSSQPSSQSGSGLARIFSAGGALQDTNADNVIDSVAARIVVALHFFDLFGRYTRGQALNYPGRIIPVTRPKGDGKPGHAKIYKGVNVYMPPKGRRTPEGGRGGGDEGGDDASNPRITYISSGTEAPDETARGDWMKIVASAGLQWDLAVLRLLYDTEFKIERREEATADGVSLAVFRPRPGTTPKVPTAPTTTSDPEAKNGMASRDNR